MGSLSKSYSSFLVIVVLILSVAVISFFPVVLAESQPPDFAISITATINSYSSTCVFGVNNSSSTLYDAKYDSLSPYQASGILASLSYNNQSAFLTQALSQYVVPSNGSTIWRLRIYSFDQAGTVTLTWNNTSIESMALKDPIFLKEYANMNAKNSYSFNMTSGGIANFNIIYQSSTTTPTPTASVPEFSWLTILPILLTTTIVLVMVRKRLQRND
jgi:hypothetical protein